MNVTCIYTKMLNSAYITLYATLVAAVMQKWNNKFHFASSSLYIQFIKSIP